MSFPVRWTDDWGDIGTCSVEEFLSDNEESLEVSDLELLIALEPGAEVTIMGGACKVRREKEVS